MYFRTSKELILATKPFAHENRSRSWAETLLTLGLLLTNFTALLLTDVLPLKVLLSLMQSLLYVRMFVVYHDYQHHAILQKSPLASALMQAFGIFMLTPQNIWKRSHDHHHAHNSKLVMHGIGSYPIITKEKYLSLSRSEQYLYLLNRHPLTVFFAYFTLFVYWLNVKSFLESPKKHLDSLLSLVLHVLAGAVIWFALGFGAFVLVWFLPFLLAFAMGAYLFYCQHNFPGATFRENPDWAYDQAALYSSSFMVMCPIMHWLTANIGYHHIHHLNSRIPFYNLPVVMAALPELQTPVTTSWNPIEIRNCFRLKLWDTCQGKMIGLNEL